MFVGSNRSGALAALAMAAALCGCANFDAAGSWFSKPVDLFGSRGGYTYSQLGYARQDRPITANDLVDANGACPIRATSAAPPPQTAQDNAGASGPVSPDTASLSGGIAIGISECDVVARLGQPTAVNLGRNPNGDRSAVLTFNSGPRPGVYRFEGGRLTEMDRVEQPPPPPQPAKKTVAKKKPVKPNEPPTTDSKT